jgi:signal transduction histidine kinase/ligand-binding sensor domain-containing protein
MFLRGRSIPTKSILLLSLTVGMLHPAAFGQEDLFIFRKINTSAGLANDRVTSIVQDDKGYIWISTENGLQKFDGNSFASYHHDPDDPQSLNSDNAGQLTKDGDDNIWLLSPFLGFNLFNPSTGKNIRVIDFKDTTIKNLNGSTSACTDNQGNIWLASLNTIVKYDVATHQVIHYDHLLPRDNSLGFPRAILCDPATGNLWLNIYGYGICMLDPQRHLFYSNRYNPEKIPVFSLVVDPGTIYLDREHNLWINTFSGALYRYNLVTLQSQLYYSGRTGKKSIRGGSISIDCMMQDRTGRIWMGARKDGLLEYFPGTDSFRLVRRDERTPGGLDYDEYLDCLFQDRDGNIWIGSDKGIALFNPYREQFHSVNLPAAADGTMNITPVLNFQEMANRDIWLATYGQGIQVFDAQLRYKENIAYESRPSRSHLSIGEPGNRVWSFLRRPGGKLFIGCQHAWLTLYDPRSGDLRSSQPGPLAGNTIINLLPDSAHHIWFALYGGIAKWDSMSGQFTHYNNMLSVHGNSETQVFDLFMDKDQHLWVATQTRGLQEFDPASGRFIKQFVPVRNDPQSISDRSVQCIAKINDSLLALGTSSGGVDLFDLHNKKFTHITTREGLPGNNISALYFQAPVDLWVAGAQGLCKVDLNNRRVFHYGIEDGILNNDFEDCLHFQKLSDGRLLLGYPGGFISFRPDSVGRMDPPPDVTLTGFRLFEQALPVDSLFNRSDTVDLSYRQNFITLEYASLSYLEPSSINYFYRLEGVDTSWVNAGGRRFASYANLSAGSYTFSVRSENRDGIPTQKTREIWIIIHPPYWQTWWFRLLLILATGLLLYGWYRYRINQLLRLQAMRNDISRDLHDDLGATLGSISLLSEVAKGRMEGGDSGQAYSLLTKISGHSREMVEKMSDIVWAINPKNEDVEKIIQRLTNFGQATCASRDVQFEIKADETAIRQPLSMELIKNVYLIVKEAMNNAIRHSGCSRLTISFQSIPVGLEIWVEDNGRGFDTGVIKRGNGLNNMESRIRELKGSLTFRSEGGGTLVGLKIPLT